MHAFTHKCPKNVPLWNSTVNLSHCNRSAVKEGSRVNPDGLPGMSLMSPETGSTMG